MHSGRLKLKQNANVAKPMKAHRAPLTVKIIREGEQEQRIGRSNPCQNTTHIIFVICPHDILTLRTQNTPCFCHYWWHTLSTSYEPPNSMKNMMRNSLPAHTSDHFHEFMEITNLDCASGNPNQEATQCGRTAKKMKTWKHHLENGIKIWTSETKLLKMWHATNLKQRKETHVIRYSFKISDSNSQCENTTDKQQMPSIKLWERIFRKFRNDDTRISSDKKDAWKKMNEEGHKWLDPKYGTLHVVKEAHVAWT